MSKEYEAINESRKFINEELYEETAEELGVEVELVREVVSANAEFTAKVIHQGAFESVIYPFLGKIKAKLRGVQKASGNVNRP